MPPEVLSTHCAVFSSLYAASGLQLDTHSSENRKSPPVPTASVIQGASHYAHTCITDALASASAYCLRSGAAVAAPAAWISHFCLHRDIR